MHEFLPYYSDTTESDPEQFLGQMKEKKEFLPLHLQDPKLYPHQKFISRFVSPYTLYNELILFHEMGSGKTQTAIEVAETLMSNPNSGISKTVVLVRGKGLGQNFLHELIHRSGYDKYFQQKNLWKTFYDFWTLEVFGKLVLRLSDQDLLNQFNHRLFIVDEAHHLKKSAKGAYNSIHRLFHLIPHRKILLLTGTPMKDDVAEFSHLANLILPLESQFPFGSEFVQFYFKEDKLVKTHLLLNRLAGRVSFHRGANPPVRKKFEGRVVAPMAHIPVVECPMDSFQEQAYLLAHKKDLQGSVVYINSRQASLFVFPDGSYGQAGFKKYVKVHKKTDLFGQITTRFKLTPELEIVIQSNLNRYSSKYKKLIEIVTGPSAPKTFIYLEFVHGGGAILLGEILKLHGYSEATGNETKPGKRFIIATTQSLSSNLMDLIERFNAPDNDSGQVIQLFIGSQIVSEGFSLKNISTEIILTPHWNFSEIEQIIARGWRLKSHTLPISHLSVYLLVAPILCEIKGDSDFNRYGIDLYMYKTAELKDYKIKQLERFLKEISIDCHLHQPDSFLQDGARECDYTTCKIKCRGAPVHADQSSFKILYLPYEKLDLIFSQAFKEKQLISFQELVDINPFDNFILLSYLSELILNNIPLSVDGKFLFLRKAGNFFYTSEDPTVPVETVTPYIPLNDKRLTLNELFTDLRDSWLMTSVKFLFEKPYLVKTILSKLPRNYQHLILTACLYAEKISVGNLIVREKILDFYQGFYRRGDPIYVWLFHEKFGTLMLEMKDHVASWVPADRDIYQEHREKLYSSPIGYYGLYNPHLDEFCLREVSQKVETDLRRIKVGRRCGDWDLKALTKIIKIKLGLKVNLENYNRADLCKMIKKEFFKRNLVMYNFDCGNQFKIRGRI